LAFDFITQNSIIYVLIAWVIIVITAKALKLDKHGFEIKPYSLTYKNYGVQNVLTRLLSKTKRLGRRLMRRPENTAKVTGLCVLEFPGNAVY